MEAEFTLRVQFSEAIHEFTPEHFAENGDGQEKLLPRVDPPRMIQSQTAGWNNTVYVRVMLQLLVPGVEDAEEADLSAETLWVAGDLKQCLGAGLE